MGRGLGDGVLDAPEAPPTWPVHSTRGQGPLRECVGWRNPGWQEGHLENLSFLIKRADGEVAGQPLRGCVQAMAVGQEDTSLRCPRLKEPRAPGPR